MHRTFLLGFLCFFILQGCSAPEEKAPVLVTVPDTTSLTASPTMYRYEVFVNVDSTGATHGYGYDVYDGNKKLIHQTNIPGEPGIDGFVNETEAGIIAQLVIDKLNAGGGFPTLSHEELVSKGITLKQ
jgi:hypothetical protein